MSEEQKQEEQKALEQASASTKLEPEHANFDTNKILKEVMQEVNEDPEKSFLSELVKRTSSEMEKNGNDERKTLR